jgi:hypothetical protein
MPEHLELPRPLRLLRTAAWSLTEAAGLPVAAYAVAAWLGGRNAGLLAALAAIWATAAIRKVATGRIPSLLTISAVVLTLQTAAVIGTGELWIFLLQFPVANLCMCVLFARTARGPNPLVARLAAEVVALRLPATHHLGLHRFFQRATWLWAGIFLALTGLLAVLMATEPGGLFLMLSTVVTTALIVAGAGASTLWFLFALRGLGLALRFAAHPWAPPGRQACGSGGCWHDCRDRGTPLRASRITGTSVNAAAARPSRTLQGWVEFGGYRRWLSMSRFG